MPKSLVLGNGNILLCFDKYAQVRDFYFPYVGLENHVGGECVHKIGVWVDGRFSWLKDAEWEISINYQHETLVSDITARNKNMEIELRFVDVVYNEKNIFIRKITIKNISKRKREIKIFFHQQFQIYESPRGDTAYYDPDNQTIVHYEGKRIFVVGGRFQDKSFDDYSVGNFDIEGKEGTWKDAEDGVLSKNPVEHGSVDSVVGFTLHIDAKDEQSLTYWITVAETLKKAQELHEYILKKSSDHLMKTTQNFWHAWVNKFNFSFYGLDEKTVDLFKKSLLIVRTHVDKSGSIVASGDSDMLQYGRDTYAYMWPRDGAFVAMALDKAGYFEITRRFFEFCNEVIDDDGYLLHKYRSDRSLGSSWHPWVKDGKKQLAIQEDETALVVYSLWNHYSLSRDLEFIEGIYNSFIKKAADFLLDFRDQETKLPLGSYDLWEEKFGTSTFTSCTVYGALEAAGNFAKLLGKKEDEKAYRAGAKEIHEAILGYLYNKKENYFYKLIEVRDGKILHDNTFDISSFYGIAHFGILGAKDERLVKVLKVVEEKIFCCKTKIGGGARYEGDKYYQVSQDIPGNPWFITTFWIVQHYISRAESEKDLDVAKRWIQWAVDLALPSGILSEQLNPYTGEQISVAPLTWSHAEFVTTIIKYLEKLEEFGVCKVCNPVR